MIVDGADEFDRLFELFLGDVARTAQDYRSCVLDLVLVELLEVLKIDPALGSVDNSDRAADLGAFNALNCSYNVRELAYAGGLNEDPVGCELVDNVLQSRAEISYEAAADAAGIHLCDLDAGFLEKTTVDADLAEFIFDKYELGAVISVSDKLLYQCCLACSQKS